ncbi:DMT family transporter [Fusibacter bizertensis]|uniref:DMT family transporter n=1 Tax=Fusibacter bizertensis TaxID=1488331 RepID=A0ABT6N9N1_9FIRM|nr:DMT family transporter [Fusibacter bizertensis]MDH8677125.1 DMT family transporter [Fusibacter bizertensis]
MTHKYTNLKIYLLMIMATFFWAGAFIAAKLGVYELSPTILTFLRMGIAAVIIFPIMVIKLGTNWKLKKNEIKIVLATSIVGMIGYHMFFFTALKYTTASNASMINATNPLITAVLASLFASERITPKKIAMLLLAFCGVVYIIIAGNINSLATLVLNKGDFIMLCGTFLWAVYGIIVKKAVPIMGPLKLTTYTFLFCALIMAPFAIFAFATTNAFSVGINPYIAVIYMAIFPTVIGYSIQQYAIAQIGPSKASLFINLVPIISTILAVIFLNEHIRSYHLIGATMIITAVIVYNHSGFLIKKDKSVQD